jgi:recombination protein RecA
LLAAFPPGKLSEIVGPRSSGGSSLLLQLLARATHAGGHAALVDAIDALDAASAIASGVALSRLLWVRCGGRLASAVRAADLLGRCPGFAVVAVDLGDGSIARDVWPASLGVRLQRAVEGTATILVLRAPHRLTGSAAAFVVSLHSVEARWTGAPRATRLTGLVSEARVLRSRLGAALDASSIEWRL